MRATFWAPIFLCMISFHRTNPDPQLVGSAAEVRLGQDSSPASQRCVPGDFRAPLPPNVSDPGCQDLARGSTQELSPREHAAAPEGTRPHHRGHYGLGMGPYWRLQGRRSHPINGALAFPCLVSYTSPYPRASSHPPRRLWCAECWQRRALRFRIHVELCRSWLLRVRS